MMPPKRTDPIRAAAPTQSINVPELATSIASHDAAITASGLDIWIGAEPTFTLRGSEQPQWLSQALGGDKQAYALRLVRKLQQNNPGSLILRTVGRQYGGEKVPRWSFGLYQRRDPQPAWQGPPDPVLTERAFDDSAKLREFAGQLNTTLTHAGWHCQPVAQPPSTAELRLLASLDGASLQDIDPDDARLSRVSVHDRKTPESGLSDELAKDGYLLFVIKVTRLAEQQAALSVELPLVQRMAAFRRILDALATAASNAHLSHLVLAGYPPPVDRTVAWTTVTPDPAVIEINQAPQPSIQEFFESSRELYAIAEQLGLSPYRLHYNGKVSDSGGGGQFTLGGPEVDRSPFFIAPRLLPRLVRYFTLHPALSYLFATEYVGGASQSPRCDEGTRDAFRELAIALDHLERQAEVSRELLHQSLAPFLVDASGNAHRSELNIEKLWNPALPQRGCLGLLEFRAFRMPLSAQRAVAIAMLLRSICAMLVDDDRAPQLQDWQDELHDRFALPLFLQEDLEQVLADIAAAGCGLDPVLRNELLEDPNRGRWSCPFESGELRIEQAIEYWPLVGDVATQETGGSRLVDSSTLRLQLSLHAGDAARALDDWRLQIADYLLPLQARHNGSVRLIGLRYRDFAPWRGLHPTVVPLNPVVLYLSSPRSPDAYRIELHNWRPNSIPYDGLPRDFADAAKRRTERFSVATIRRDQVPAAKSAPTGALSTYCFDLRCV